MIYLLTSDDTVLWYVDVKHLKEDTTTALRAVSLRDVVSPFGWLRHGSALRMVSLRDLTA